VLILEGSIAPRGVLGHAVVRLDRLDWQSMEGADRLRSRLASLRCADCGRAYGDGHVRIRAERGSVAFVDLICRACGRQASAIATIVADGTAAARVELGDLDEAAASPIEIEEVLRMERFLADFDGDFRRLFRVGGGLDGSPPA
jgi:hypothetical protein